MKRVIILVAALGLLLLTLPALARGTSPLAAAYATLDVSNVRLLVTEDEGATLLFDIRPAACETITTATVAGTVIAVEAYAPSPDVTCDEPVNSASVELGELEPDQNYTLLLNDFASLFFLPQPEGVIMDVRFPITWDEENQLVRFQRVDGQIDDLSLSDDDTLTVSGTHPDGCETDTVAALLPDAVDPDLLHLSAFRLIPEGVMCPASLQDFEVTLDTTLEQPVTVQAGDAFYRVEGDTIMQVQRRYAFIETVIITPRNGDFRALVSGARNGNCGGELTALQRETEYGTLIDIFEQTEAEVDCTADAPFYDAIFTVETLPVIVNGMAFDRDGAVDVSAQTTPPDSESERDGNFMRVDTVIENVEVNVLEATPIQLEVSLRGYQPDGCDLPVIVDERRDGQTVTLHIYREMPLDVMCPAVLVPYEETITLESTFERGPVTLNVNEETLTINFE